MKEKPIKTPQLASTTLPFAPSITAGQTPSLTNMQLARTNAKTRPFPLLDLPPELVLVVFDSLREQEDWCTLTCLGLTCTYLYNTLKKRYHPGPIPLEHYIWRSMDASIKRSQASNTVRRISNYVPLVELIRGFIGPKYRLLGGVFPPLFVCRDIYGDEDDLENKEEKNLRGRLWDYRLMTYNDWTTGQTIHMLPNPFNKGDDWYDEVFERWMDFENQGWTQNMLQHWRRTMRDTSAAKILCQRGSYYRAFWHWMK